MKIKHVLLILLTAIIVTGCSAGAVGTQKESADGGYDSYIEYNSWQIQSRLTITDIRSRMQGDLLQVSVDLKNAWKFKLDFQYKFKFYDKDGFEIDPDGRPWTPIVITGNEISTVQALAPNPTATTFKIVVRD